MTKETLILSIKNLTPFLIARIIALFVFILLIFFIRSQITNSTQKAAIILNDISTQISIIDQAAELKQQYNNYYPLLPKIQALLPGQDNLPDFVSDVEAAGKRAGMDFTTIKFVGEPLPSSTSISAKEIAIVLNAGGTGVKFTDLFKELASIPYFMNLSAINIDAQGGIDGTALLQANGTLFLK
ncbi:MAG: hypothetical protein UU22_C0004G0006 [Parcubacteria group bacterium GW2011_GWA2_40_8]|nr:MAG: hypothetical protein UU22_C0004G0006 [Parcubacteria group bacterium GW2011_GWA2_40_8]